VPGETTEQRRCLIDDNDRKKLSELWDNRNHVHLKKLEKSEFGKYGPDDVDLPRAALDRMLAALAKWQASRGSEQGLFDVQQFLVWLHDWQVLVASSVALIAAGVAVHNTNKLIRNAATQETHRRKRKLAALRAVLPHVLAQMAEYAEKSARALNSLMDQCDDKILRSMAAQEVLVQPLPTDALKILVEFIEYSDTLDVGVIEDTVGWMQIHNSRCLSLVERNRDTTGIRIVTRFEIKSAVIDAAAVYAGVSAIYQYARQQDSKLPSAVGWDAVSNALWVFTLMDDEFQNLIAQRAKMMPGPFAQLHMTPTALLPEMLRSATPVNSKRPS
jgi:hypothetical protein